jgi:hypothetical protein
MLCCPIDPTEANPCDIPYATVATVSDDLTCRRCGYNLRGLEVSGRCPECNSDVALSMQSDMLSFANPYWLRTLARGATVLCVGLSLGLLFSLGSFLLPRFVRWPNYPFLIASIFGWPVVMLAGLWLVTAPDPVGLGEINYGRSRRFVRIGQLIGLVLAIPYGTGGLPVTASSGVFLLFLLLHLGRNGLRIAVDIAFYDYLGKFAARIPSNSLARQARWFRVLVPALAGLTLLLYLPFMTYLHVNGPTRVFQGPFISIYSVFSGVLTLAHLGLSIAEVSFMISYTRALRQRTEMCNFLAPGALQG